MTETPQSIIAYWAGLSEKEWFSEGKNPELDEYIQNRFQQTHSDAFAGRMDSWKETSDGRFALIILFDQLSRHIYRLHPRRYFLYDSIAREISTVSLTLMDDKQYNPELHRFFYFPFLHSENLDDLKIARAFAVQRNYTRMIGNMDKNIQILTTFGRYPWRNAFLKRYTTQEELDWFKTELGAHKLSIELVRHKLEDWCLSPEHEKETK